MDDHLCFLMYEEQGTKEERNRETERRGVLGTIMDGSQGRRSMCQTVPDREGARTARGRTYPASLPSQKPPLTLYWEKAWLGSSASPEAQPSPAWGSLSDTEVCASPWDGHGGQAAPPPILAQPLPHGSFISPWVSLAWATCTYTLSNTSEVCLWYLSPLPLCHHPLPGLSALGLFLSILHSLSLPPPHAARVGFLKCI